ncbi:uncharacterized protein LOC124252968 [Haliotis rubra]|uniref:uncharacterized protein LOC124252968 n=1 Tax=Haliotis rubra TaxID=36100 RepID=UPI001EE6212B|nr:uncharacterized protein LOC124252968 [Haliotis rubra]
MPRRSQHFRQSLLSTAFMSAMLILLLSVLQSSILALAAIEGVPLQHGACVCVTEGLVDAYSTPGFDSESITYLSFGQCLRSNGQSLEMNGDSWYSVMVKNEEITTPLMLWVAGRFLKQGNTSQCS